MFLNVIQALITCAIFLFVLKYLLDQSKNPSGRVGIMMMKIWQKTYLPMVKWSLKNVYRDDVSQILDIGVGSGWSSVYLSEKFTGSKIYGIDISEDAVRFAQENYLDKPIIFENKSASDAGYSDDSFDLICSFQSHFHWQDQDKSFAELSRILSKKGQIIIACEENKINFFLPKWKNSQWLQSYFNSFRLNVVSVDRQNGWVCYTIRHL